MEKQIWKGHPSHWIDLKTHIFCVLFFWLVIPIFIALWRIIILKCWEIVITDQRVIETKGVFSKTSDELELYRVKDIQFDQPFCYRFVGLSNITLLTSDKSHPVFKIPAIKDGERVREELRSAIDLRRDEKNVLETDVNFSEINLG